MLFLFCDFTTPPKEKFLILVSINCGLLFFVVNSEINSFKQSSPDILESQVKLARKEHSFLKHDSWIDCSRVIRHLSAAEILQQIQSKLGSLKGTVAEPVRKQIRQVVSDSRTLENRFKAAILQDLADCGTAPHRDETVDG